VWGRYFSIGWGAEKIGLYGFHWKKVVDWGIANLME